MRPTDEQLIERYFSEHEAKYGRAVIADREVEVLEWKEPGTSIHFIRYVACQGVLSVAGDLGEAVYLTGADNLKWWARCDIDYFASKCEASETGRGYKDWDDVAAEVAFRAEIASMREEGRVIDEDQEEDGVGAINEGKFAWECWLRDQGHEVFGDDWWDFAPRYGVVIHDRCRLHLLGLKAALKAVA